MMRNGPFVAMVVTLSCVLLAASLQAQSGNGALKVTSFPSGAHVSIDGTDTGKTTPMSVSLPLGDHSVVVSIPGSGWNPDSRTVTIVSGNNDLSVTLLPAVSQGPQGPPGPAGDPGPQGPPGAGTHADPPCFDNFNRYVDCGNGTVTDTVTGLIWLKHASCLGHTMYAAANQAATGLADGECGLTDGSSMGDWRLPTKAEWEASIARAVALDCIGLTLTNDTGTACLNVGPTSFLFVPPVPLYWSSSAYEDNPDFAWRVDLKIGSVNVVNHKLSEIDLFVWPVRGGP